MIDIKPIGENILVKVIEVDRTTTSGLIIPQSAQSNKFTAFKVLEAGPQLDEDMVGLTLIGYGQMAGIPVDEEDKVYLIPYDTNNFLGVLRDEAYEDFKSEEKDEG